MPHGRGRPAASALELEPDQPFVLNYLGYTWVDQGQNLDRAKAMLHARGRVGPRGRLYRRQPGLGLLPPRRACQGGDLSRASGRAGTRRPASSTTIWATPTGERAGSARRAFQWRRALTFNPEPAEIAEAQAKLRNGCRLSRATAQREAPRGCGCRRRKRRRPRSTSTCMSPGGGRTATTCWTAWWCSGRDRRPLDRRAGRGADPGGRRAVRRGAGGREPTIWCCGPPALLADDAGIAGRRGAAAGQAPAGCGRHRRRLGRCGGGPAAAGPALGRRPAGGAAGGDSAERLGADIPVCLAARPLRMQGWERCCYPPLLCPHAAWCWRTGCGAGDAGGVPGPPGPASRRRQPAGRLGRCGRDGARPGGRAQRPGGTGDRALPAGGGGARRLRALPGCLLARMSGSGATCFGLFADAAGAAAGGPGLPGAGAFGRRLVRRRGALREGARGDYPGPAGGA